LQPRENAEQRKTKNTGGNNMNDFIKALDTKAITQNILVTFRNGQQDIYTTNILNLLKTDKDVTEIMDMETGELLFYR